MIRKIFSDKKKTKSAIAQTEEPNEANLELTDDPGDLALPNTADQNESLSMDCKELDQSADGKTDEKTKDKAPLEDKGNINSTADIGTPDKSDTDTSDKSPPDEDTEEEQQDTESLKHGEDDLLAPAYDLEHGERWKSSTTPGKGNKLPWSSGIASAKEFFNTAILYRYDLLEMGQREALRGKYRIELKGHEGGVWTLGLGDDVEVINRREEADIVVSMQQQDFLSLINGELNPQIAIVAKKIRITGDVAKGVALQTILAPMVE